MKNLFSLTLTFFISYSLLFAQEIEALNPKLNTALTREIGESVLTSGKIIKVDVIKITETFEVRSGFTKFQHFEGKIYPLVDIKKGFKIYYERKNSKEGRFWGLGINEKNPKEKIPVLISMIRALQKWKIKDKIEETTQILLCDDCFRQEFIYNGKKGNVVNFAYREFYADIARSSYFQNLEYDVEESDVIGFKGMRLKILKATNTSINYEILIPFNTVE